MAKPKEKLTNESPLLFNGCRLSLTNDSASLELKQKGQGKKLELVDFKIGNFQQSYVQQRAREAYIAFICQPEASYDLSVAAQHQDPSREDVLVLNKRLKWQMKNINRGIKYIPLDFTSNGVKRFVFVHGSFANNKDFSSQIGYEIIIGIEEVKAESKFNLT
ncbi:hypothetical protein K3495_g17360, partial [Podosphaera aphanis]